MTPVADVVREVRLLRREAKQMYLTQLIGPRTDEAAVLHWRALLMTALNEGGVWPPR